MPAPLLPEAADLAPGDANCSALRLSEFAIDRIRSVTDPRFDEAYAALWAEFGRKGQMERREVLAGRFAHAPALRYELVLVRGGGAIAAIRDHTAIFLETELIVHLSHLLVTPEFRGTGLAGWMRAFPAAFARELAPGLPVTLAAELEYANAADERSMRHLRSYDRGGFRKVDPRVVDYYQPDFRAPEEIAATGGPRPVPLQLCLREAGRPPLGTISGARLRVIVSTLYRMYRAGLSVEAMAHPALDLADYPAASACILMVRPTTAFDHR